MEGLPSWKDPVIGIVRLPVFLSTFSSIINKKAAWGDLKNGADHSWKWKIPICLCSSAKYTDQTLIIKVSLTSVNSELKDVMHMHRLQDVSRNFFWGTNYPQVYNVLGCFSALIKLNHSKQLRKKLLVQIVPFPLLLTHFSDGKTPTSMECIC